MYLCMCVCIHACMRVLYIDVCMDVCMHRSRYVCMPRVTYDVMIACDNGLTCHDDK